MFFFPLFLFYCFAHLAVAQTDERTNAYTLHIYTRSRAGELNIYLSLRIGVSKSLSRKTVLDKLYFLKLKSTTDKTSPVGLHSTYIIVRVLSKDVVAAREVDISLLH